MKHSIILIAVKQFVDMEKLGKVKEQVCERLDKDKSVIFLGYNDENSYAVVHGDPDEIAKGLFDTILGNQGNPISKMIIQTLKSVVSNLMLHDADCFNDFVKLVENVSAQADAMDDLGDNTLN